MGMCGRNRFIITFKMFLGDLIHSGVHFHAALLLERDTNSVLLRHRDVSLYMAQCYRELPNHNQVCYLHSPYFYDRACWVHRFFLSICGPAYGSRMPVGVLDCEQ